MSFTACFHGARTVLAALSIAAISLTSVFAEDDAPSATPRVLAFAPPSGSGPVVVVISGNSGTGNYEFVANDVAKLGYSTVLVDGKDILAKGLDGGPVLRKIITDAQAASTAKPGKVVVIGFSQGGGAALVYATAMQRSVAGVIVYYPQTHVQATPERLAERMRVPVLMFAGGRDHYHDCCLIETAHALETAAAAAKAPFELIVYPDADHGFNHRGRDFRPQDTADAWKRTQDRLGQLSPLQ
jgi:dienelactone hydrolase